MTKEQAIDIIKCLAWHTRPNEEEIEQAIKALEQQPSEDCVSRTEAIKELKESAEHHANDTREEVLLRRDRDIIRALPPVTPTFPKGATNGDIINENQKHCSFIMLLIDF